MGFEQRGRYFYYYRKIFLNGKVISRYKGRGDLARLEVQKDLTKKQTREAFSRFRSDYDSEQEQLRDSEAAINGIVTDVLLANGFHCHKSQWRRRVKLNAKS